MNDAAQHIVRMPEELWQLADSACNGTLTVDQQKRLERLLYDDKTTQITYLSYLDIHAQLLWEGRSGGEPPIELPPDLAVLSGRDGCPAMTGQVPAGAEAARNRRAVGWAVAGLVVAVVMAIAVFGVRRHFWPPVADPVSREVATWVRSLDAKWQDDASRAVTPLPGDPLAAGTYQLKHGVAEIRFGGGAMVTLEAPAKIELIDSQTGGLEFGRLVAVVPSRAIGFSIRTPAASIVDRGTEFGVAVKPTGETFVQTYDGVVGAESIAPETDETRVAHRIWPLAAIRFPADAATVVKDTPFEPLRFVRRCPESGPSEVGVAVAPRISLDGNADATAHVKTFAADIETMPATALQVGAIYEGCVDVNDLTQSELQALIPALLEMLSDQRPLARGSGFEETPVRLRVADRAELVLEFIAGVRPAGEDRQKAWGDWWAAAKGRSRAEWLADRRTAFAQSLVCWRSDASYPANLYARNAVEVAARARDRTVLPDLMEVLRCELPVAHETEMSVAAIMKCVGQLGSAELVPELVDLARALNHEQTLSLPQGYSVSHARRSEALRALATALDQLAGTKLASTSLQTVGPTRYGMFAIERGAFEQWLKAAERRAGEPHHQSPSDLPDSASTAPSA